MLLRHSLRLETEAQAIETAVKDVLASGARTRDIARGGASIGTVEMTDRVIAQLTAAASR